MIEVSYIVGLLKSEDLSSLGKYRHLNWELSDTGEGEYLVKAPSLSQDTFASLPLLARYFIEDGKLIPQDKTLPTRNIITTKWYSLTSFLPLSPVLARENEDYFDHFTIELENAKEFQEPIAMVTTLQSFIEWVEMASVFRLSLLKYAVSAEEKVFVLGDPLPPISGSTYYRLDRMLLPIGKTISQNVHSDFIYAALDLSEGQIAIFNGTEFEIIDDQYLIPVTRSGVRKLKPVIV